jgi:hypothetical protein
MTARREYRSLRGSPLFLFLYPFLAPICPGVEGARLLQRIVTSF